MSVGRVADLVSRADPGAIAIIDGERRVSYGELDQLIDRAVTALLGSGLASGDRVAVQLGTGLDFATIYLAASRAGLVTVPLNPDYTEPERDFALADSGARLLITGARMRPALPSIGGGDELAGWLAAAGPADAPRRAARTQDPERLAVLLYTSGTSGRPKAAMLSDRALLANLDQLAALDPPTITAVDRVFVPIPLFHIFGLTCGLGATLHVGATAVLSDEFNTASSLAVMAREHVTTLVGVPSMFAAWSAHPGFARGFASVRFAASGSAPLSASVLARYTGAGYRLFEGYGLTEAAPAITTNWSVSQRPKPGSVGRPLPGVEVALRDPSGEPVDQDDEGELFVRGPNLFSGYWPDGAGGPDHDGWFGTGDIAIQDPDGDLALIGRTTDLVIVSGFNVYPAEVEAVMRSIDGIDEVAVLGVPDERTGEAVVAYVVAAPDAQLDEARVLAEAARSLARFKLPRSVELVDALPHTVTGKVMKWRLREGGAGGDGRN
jgi:long-chain acyl-CoA synthetase